MKYDNPGDEEIVEIHENIPPIETTLATYRFPEQDNVIVNKWVRKIKKIYSDNKRRRRIVLGLLVESSHHYKNVDYVSFLENKKNNVPFQLFQICIGQHCLFYYTSFREPKKNFPRALRDLLLDDKTVVSAVRMGSLMPELEDELELRFVRPLDLNRAAAYLHEKIDIDYYAGYNSKLSKAVLCDGVFDWEELWNGVRGGSRSINWWRPEDDDRLSDQKVKCGTFEAFLACKMGVKLLLQ